MHPARHHSATRWFSRLVLLCSGIAAVVTPGATLVRGQTNISTGAYTVLNSRTTANRNSFFVYLDQDSGFNHGFPSGLFASNPANRATIHLDSGCVYATTALTGCSTDPNVVDRTRGTVMRISFDGQTPGNFAGVNFEEPEGAPQTGTGYDLRGANNVTFDIFSPNAAMVQFGIGGCVTPYTAPLPATWTAMTIALDTLSCTPDLSNVHLLFGVGTNDGHAPQGATVLVDNIQFTPVPTSRQSALGFPLGNQTFGVLPQQVAPIPFDQVLRNGTTIYESSLTELVLLTRAGPQDLSNARLIADTFDFALHHDSHGLPLPVAKDGSVGLHNGYENGDIALFNTQQLPKQGQAGDVRLSGFTATTLCAPSGFCLLNDGATGGNDAFAILALVRAYDQFGDTRYLNDAATIGSWLVGNLSDTTGSGYGGYFLGYPDMGVPAPKPLQRGKSVENNADIFAAFTALVTVESQLGNASAAASWTTAANVGGDFVMQMFDPATGRFNAGTVPVGSQPGPGICPTGVQRGDDVLNGCDFLDANTFTTLALAGSPRYQGMIDWRRPVQHVLDTFKETATAGGTTFLGFDIVATPTSGANGVAWEFTGQVVEVMRFVDRLYTDSRFETSADFYLSQIALAQSSAPFGDGSGLVAATLQNGDITPPSRACIQTPFQCVEERVALAATNWAIIAEQKLNVFAPPAVAVVAPVFTSLAAPARLADTRVSGGPIASGSSRCFTVAGLDGIPADAAAVVLNVSAVGQTTNGWLTVYPSAPSAPVPATSTLNFGTSEYAIANGIATRVGSGAQVCVNVGTVDSVPGSSHVILDATAYAPSSALAQLTLLQSPVRVMDTRANGGPIATTTSRCFQVAGLMGIPADAAAVFLNVTAVGYATEGWLTVYPAGQPVPATSTVNFGPPAYAIANNTLMRVDSGGQVCVNVGTVNAASGSSQVIVDATGYLAVGGLAHLPLLASPRRVVDTRISGGPIATGTSRCFTLAGLTGIPANARAVVLNVTAVGYPTPGWLTVYPGPIQVPPPTSTLNFDISEYAMANSAIVGLGGGGQVCVAVGTINPAAGSSDVILDVSGYF